MKTFKNKYNENRIIALWAFSESILGGFFHLFKIPVTGLIIGGLAIIFLSLLSYNNMDKKSILKGTLIVLIIKFVISPYTPINAFFSVAIQGFLCYFFSIVFNGKYFRIFGFALSSMIVFSLQKLLFIQILFGNSLWEAIDSYMLFISKQFGYTNNDINISIFIIAFYISIHVLSGIIFSIISIKIIDDLQNEEKLDYEKFSINEAELFDKIEKKQKNKTKQLLLTFLILVVIGISYFIKPEEKFYNYIIVLIRFISIFFLWAYIVAPLLTKLASLFLSKKQNVYKNEVNTIIDSFGNIKKLANVIWTDVKNELGVLKYIKFIRSLIVIFIKEN